MTVMHRDEALINSLKDLEGVPKAFVLTVYCCHRAYQVCRMIEVQSARQSQSVDRFQVTRLEWSLCELSEAIVLCKDVPQQYWQDLDTAWMAEPILEVWNGLFSGPPHNVVLQWCMHIIRTITMEIALQEQAKFDIPIEPVEVIQSSFLILNQSDLGLEGSSLFDAYTDPFEHAFPEGYLGSRLQAAGLDRLRSSGILCSPASWKLLWAHVERQSLHTENGAESLQSARALVEQTTCGPLYTLTEACDRFEVTRDQLYGAIKNGEIRSHRSVDAPKRSRHLIAKNDLVNRYRPQG